MTVPIRKRARSEMESWDPFREFSLLQDRMGRLFDDLIPARPRLKLIPAGTTGAFVPDIEVFETDTDVVVKAHVPGIDQKDLDITVDEDSVTIKGEVRRSEEEKTEHGYYSEVAYGSFSRTLPLSSEVEPDKAEAHLEKGVLELHVPKSAEEKAKAKKVKIS